MAPRVDFAAVTVILVFGLVLLAGGDWIPGAILTACGIVLLALVIAVIDRPRAHR